MQNEFRWENLERVKGIEPSRPAWKAGTLPLSYTRLRFATAGQTRRLDIAKSLFEHPNRAVARRKRMVERAGFEPANACADRFTVCCH